MVSRLERRPEALPEAIREMRLRLRKKTTELAQLLGTSQATMSRWENGKSLPGYIHLARLLSLAEGPERGPIITRVEELVGREQAGRILDEVERMGTSAEAAILGEALRTAKPNLVRFAQLTKEIAASGAEIPASLPGILALWRHNDSSDPFVRDRFADAESFLRVILAARPTSK